ncbi:hypothetical protein SSPS47_26280 [Streptomyces sp. S4.7]|uniref:DUF485 domain-containing protein n=1 Tax=Streptomyces sp. S4.7 TaxID=2705439 RepID=UPI0013990A49|nr:DUF485 domain-containing protein [Streptomyces sp. S4.7]QHY98621.1 hypothetical protein SSPS47_26280 [Streptomyces sp. S4.7]
MEKQEGRGAATVRTDDPWYDALASGWGELDGTGAPTTPVAPATTPATATATATVHAGGGAGEPGEAAEHGLGAADIYLEVQRSAAFQEVRARYRRFVFPATAAFLVWYLAYVVAATTAPDLMARPVAGAVNVAMVAGLGQFLSTFLLTWAYSRHARLHLDRDALDLRWSVFDLTRSRELGTARQSGTPGEPGTARAGERRR